MASSLGGKGLLRGSGTRAQRLVEAIESRNGEFRKGRHGASGTPDLWDEPLELGEEPDHYTYSGDGANYYDEEQEQAFTRAVARHRTYRPED